MFFGGNMRRNWIKVYVDQSLRGTMISELTAAERWAWIGILLMAGDSNEDGRVFLRKNAKGELIGFSEPTISELLGLDINEFKSAKEKMIKYDKILIDKNNVIQVINWKKYQSEYQRQRPYREFHKSDEINNNLNSNQNNNLDRDIDKDIDKEKKGPKLKFSDVHMDLALLLKKAISERLPKLKVAGSKYIENWANTFRIMIENEEATDLEIKKLIYWIFGESDFWYKNILSADKLRKQFGRIWEEMKDAKPKRDMIGQSRPKTKPIPGYDKDHMDRYIKQRTEKEKELMVKYKYSKVTTETERDKIESKIQDDLAKWTKEYYLKNKKERAND